MWSLIDDTGIRFCGSSAEMEIAFLINKFDEEEFKSIRPHVNMKDALKFKIHPIGILRLIQIHDQI